MKTLGQKLKEAREKKGISLNEVAVATKINIKILSAIEDGDVKSLPQKTFLRGFIRSYASYLKLDVNEVLNEFHENIGSTRPVVKTDPPSLPEESSQQTEGKSARKIIFFIIGAVLVGASALIFEVIKKYERESVVTANVIPPPSPAVVEDFSIPAEPSIAAEAPSPALQETPQESIVVSPIPLISQSPLPPQQPVEEKPQPLPSPQPQDKARPSQEIIFEAFDQVTIEVFSDGLKNQTLNMQGGQIRTVKLRGKVSIEISNGGAVNVIHNGRDRGVPGVLGQPHTMKLP